MHALVEVVERSNTPCPPPRRESLVEVDSGGDTVDPAAETEDDTCDGKHGDILRGGLEEDTDEGDDGEPKHGAATTEPIGEHPAD